MPQNPNTVLKNSSPYSAAITREQFLFFEMRTTAKLKAEGLSDKDTVERMVSDILYQYPTEKSLVKMANACIRRLNIMENDTLVSAIAELPCAGSLFPAWYESESARHNRCSQNGRRSCEAVVSGRQLYKGTA